MPVNEITETIQNQFIDGVKAAQDAVVDGVRTVAETMSSVVPDLPTLPFAENLPQPATVVADAIAFADRVYALQKEFVTELLEAAAPLTAKTASAPSAN